MVIVCSDGEQTKDCPGYNNDRYYPGDAEDAANCMATAIAAATPLKDGGATVFSWGFGTISTDTLVGIASSASKVHALHMHVHMHYTFNLQPPRLIRNLSSYLSPHHSLSPLTTHHSTFTPTLS